MGYASWGLNVISPISVSPPPPPPPAVVGSSCSNPIDLASQFPIPYTSDSLILSADRGAGDYWFYIDIDSSRGNSSIAYTDSNITSMALYSSCAATPSPVLNGIASEFYYSTGNFIKIVVSTGPTFQIDLYGGNDI